MDNLVVCKNDSPPRLAVKQCAIFATIRDLLLKENSVKLNLFDRTALALVTVFLGILALRPMHTPEAVRAQGVTDHLYIEPGVHPLLSPDKSRQTEGKIMVDLTTGNIWGFPTGPDTPYPIDRIKTQPATSSPIYLGKYDLTGMQRQ